MPARNPTQRTRPTPAVDPTHCNEVRLVGRLAAAPTEATLPSGDVVVSWRLVVDRDSRARRAPSGEGARRLVDTLDCAAWTSSVRRRVAAWQAGDVVAVDGVLRRRFWRGTTGPVSRYEVEAASVKRLTRAG